MKSFDRVDDQANLQLILRLRLLIARAANGDSLAWWDDESLTAHARFILERTFPVAPDQAARSLALRAALARHQAVCPSGSLHLYRLDHDNRDGLALRFHSLESVVPPIEPIETVDTLREHVLELIGEPFGYEVVQRLGNDTIRIEIPQGPTDVEPMVHRARTLALAYLEGSTGQPMISFCV